MTTQDKIKVMQHFADGGKVQLANSFNGEWVDTDDPWWQWMDTEYRIKPKPKLRPFTLEEAHRLVGRVVRHKDSTEQRSMILDVADGRISLRFTSWSPDEFLNTHELFNSVTGEWGPCGMEVESE